MRCLLVRIERKSAKMKSAERKSDTRRKIQLGGLVIKAGIENEATATILGLLLDAAEKLNNSNRQHVNKLRTDFKIKGDIALTKEKELL